jgi:putative phosphoesterase
MTKIFLLSDTHSHWNNEWNKYIESAYEIWHAGDIGNESVLLKIKQIAKDKTVRAVYGNIDGHTIRIQTKEYLSFQLEGLNILIIHIAGSFGKYNQKTKELISVYRPDILVCGHSHILKIKWDEKYQLWYINPGAAGIYGFHKVSTALFFELNQKRIQNLKVIEWKKTINE